MSTVITDIADAVVTKLNGSTWDQSFTATRKYAPTYRLRDMDTLTVTVVPAAEITTLVGRSTRSHEYTIDVGVQKRFSSSALATIDPLMDLVQDINDAFVRAALSGYSSAKWTGSEIDPIFAPDHFQQFRQFTSVVHMTYVVHR